MIFYAYMCAHTHTHTQQSNLTFNGSGQVLKQLVWSILYSFYS